MFLLSCRGLRVVCVVVALLLWSSVVVVVVLPLSRRKLCGRAVVVVGAGRVVVVDVVECVVCKVRWAQVGLAEKRGRARGGREARGEEEKEWGRWGQRPLRRLVTPLEGVRLLPPGGYSQAWGEGKERESWRWRWRCRWLRFVQRGGELSGKS